jgi:hypothetical protein
MRFEQMTANDTAIGSAENGMEMQSRTLFDNGNIAEERQDLDLFIDDNFCIASYASRNTRAFGRVSRIAMELTALQRGASTRMSSTSQKTSCATRQCPRTR